VFSGVLPDGTVDVGRGRETHLHGYTRLRSCSFKRSTGRIEHLAGTLRKSPIDTLDRISRGHGVEGHEHVNCSIYWSLPGEAARVAIAVLAPFHTMTTTDSVESISWGLAKSLSEVLNLPTSSALYVVPRQ